MDKSSLIVEITWDTWNMENNHLHSGVRSERDEQGVPFFDTGCCSIHKRIPLKLKIK